MARAVRHHLYSVVDYLLVEVYCLDPGHRLPYLLAAEQPYVLGSDFDRVVEEIVINLFCRPGHQDPPFERRLCQKYWQRSTVIQMRVCYQYHRNLLGVHLVEIGLGVLPVFAHMQTAVEHDLFASVLEDDAGSADLAACAQRCYENFIHIWQSMLKKIAPLIIASCAVIYFWTRHSSSQPSQSLSSCLVPVQLQFQQGIITKASMLALYQTVAQCLKEDLNYRIRLSRSRRRRYLPDGILQWLKASICSIRELNQIFINGVKEVWQFNSKGQDLMHSLLGLIQQGNLQLLFKTRIRYITRVNSQPANQASRLYASKCEEVLKYNADLFRNLIRIFLDSEADRSLLPSLLTMLMGDLVFMQTEVEQQQVQEYSPPKRVEEMLQSLIRFALKRC